ncbi:MAG: leucine-rich repeat domain-containing protein, partial [Treponema sp.]|nr:leucine-rich repeat domain-containing protein [Treponema sp.]
AGTALSGETAAAYTPPTDTIGIVYYYVIVTNTLGSRKAATSSDTAAILVNDLINAQVPNITTQPQSAFYTTGATAAALSVTVGSVTDGGVLSYQWYSNTDNNNTGGTVISGQTAAAYTPPTDTTGIVYYYVKVTNKISDNGDGGNKAATLASDPAAVTVAFTSLAEIGTYLAGASGGASDTDPVLLPVEMVLSKANWEGIIAAINTGGKYVALDLSSCARGSHSSSSGGGGLYSDGAFDPDPYQASATGKEWIVSLTLPDAATSIADGDLGDVLSYMFQYFTSLTSVSGKNVTYIGEVAFRSLSTLETISFPGATNIGYAAFRSCTALKTVNFPAAESIDDRAFAYCTALTTVEFPAVTTIGSFAFQNCTALTTLKLPANPPTILTINGGGPYGVFVYTHNPSAPTTLSIKVPSGRVGTYTSAWGVDANTDPNQKPGVYGDNHKEILITDAP